MEVGAVGRELWWDVGLTLRLSIPVPGSVLWPVLRELNGLPDPPASVEENGGG